MTQKHKVRIEIQIKNIKLSVKFPCKVGFELQADNNKKESQQSFDIKTGVCSPGETIQLETDAVYNSKTSQYTQQKVCVSVKMITNSGTIPAGRVYFNPFLKQPISVNSCNTALEKCPDKLASLSFNYKFEVLKREENLITMPFGGYKSKIQLLNHSKSSNIFKSNGTISKVNSSAQFQRVRTPKKTQNQYQINFDTFQKSIVRNRAARDDFSKAESRAIPPLNLGEDNRTYGDALDRTENQKQLARLRAENKMLRSQQFNQKEDRLKQQNYVLQSQLEKARDKIRLYERRERQLNLQNKESKDELDKIKTKVSNFESTKSQIQIQLADKQKQIRELLLWRKKHETQYQQLQTELLSINKRMTHKQVYFQDQMKKLTQKIASIETQKQKLLFQQNSTLLKVEESQRKNQSLIKEKERTYQEERTKMMKSIQSMTNQIQIIKKQIEEKQRINHEIKIQLLKQIQDNKNHQQKNKQLLIQVQNLKIKQRNYIEHKNDLERDIIEYKGIESDRNILKKKNGDLINEVSKLTQKYERCHVDLLTNIDKIKDLQTSLTERIRQKQVLNGKNVLLNKQLDHLRKQQQKIMRQAQTLSVQNVSYQQKFQDIKVKLQRERHARDNSEKNFEVELSALSRGRQLLDSQLQQLQEVIKRLQNQINSLNIRIRSYQQTNITLNESILTKQQALIRTQQKMQQYQDLISSYEEQVKNLTNKERSQYLEIKSKDDQIFTLNKKALNIQNQHYLLTERNKQLEKSIENMKLTDSQKIKNLEKEISQQNQYILNINIQLGTTKEQLQNCQKILSSRGIQNKDLHSQIQKYIQEIANKSFDLKQKIQQIKNIQEKLEQCNKELQNSKLMRDQLMYSQQKIKKEWTQYKDATIQAMSQFLIEIGKKNSSSDISLLNFPDQSLSTMQVEAIKKINNMIARFQTSISQLNEEKCLLENENQNYRQELISLEAQNQRISIDWNSELNKTIQLFSKEIDGLKNEQVILEDEKVKLHYEIEKINNVVDSKNTYIQELNYTIQSLKNEIEEKSNTIINLNEQILTLKSSQIKYKASIQGRNFEINERNQVQLEKMRTLQQQLEKKVDAADKATLLKDESIKKLEIQMMESQYHYQKMKDKVENSQKKLRKVADQNSQYSKKNQTLQQQLKQCQEKLRYSKNLADRQSVKRQQLQLQLSKAFSNLAETQVQLEKLKSEINQIKNENQQLEQKVFQKDQKYRSALEKQQRQTMKQKQQIIELKTQLELSQFKIQQNSQQIQNLKEQLQITDSDFRKRKQALSKLKEEINSLKNNQMKNVQQISELISQKEELKEELKRYNDMKITLEDEINVQHFQLKQMYEKDKQIDRLKQKIKQLETEMTSKRQLQGVKSTNSFISNRQKSSASIDERRRVRELEALLGKRQFNITSQRHRLTLEFENERQELIQQNMRLREELKNYEESSPIQNIDLKKIESRNNQI